jgi:hypothetical protein
MLCVLLENHYKAEGALLLGPSYKLALKGNVLQSYLRWIRKPILRRQRTEEILERIIVDASS